MSGGSIQPAGGGTRQVLPCATGHTEQVAEDVCGRVVLVHGVVAPAWPRRSSTALLCERYLCLGIGYVLYSSPTGYNWYRFDYRDMRSRGIKEIRYMPYKFGIFGFTIIEKIS
jgi:hypothetical protein